MLRLENISKKYFICHEKQALVRSIFHFLRIKQMQEFWALRDVSFEAAPNSCLGIIGRNGSGKTTLLNIIAGITAPEVGNVTCSGKISTLLTLGAGFHSELTGEENIYLNGTILGMTIAQIKERFQSIVDFSELHDFIDAPLRTYSAGMQMRLGFAVATHVDFDILLIDEILSVGDIAFQEKCLKRLKEFRSMGKSILMVSHSLEILKEFCDEIILMEKGRIALKGSPCEVVAKYQKKSGTQNQEYNNKETKDAYINEKTKIFDTNDKKLAKNQVKVKSGIVVDVYCLKKEVGSLSKEVVIEKVRFLDRRRVENNIFETGEFMKIDVTCQVYEQVFDPHFGIAIFHEDGVYCYGPNTRLEGILINSLKTGTLKFSIEYKELNLLPGKYFISVAVWKKDEKAAYDYHPLRYNFEVISNKKDHGIFYLKHKWRIRF